ncbi:hypothetical protein C0995_006108 [Termitomyces sp. Mi166|nr:hypothetical protein C0995_006108 [Termitomyces sp. Mi166\
MGKPPSAESLAAIKHLQWHVINNFIRQMLRSHDWQGKVLINLSDYVEIVGILKFTAERDLFSYFSSALRLNTGNMSAYKIMTRKFYMKPLH